MPYPANVSTVTVTGSWATSDGGSNKPTGNVTFVPNVRLIDAGTGTIIERVPIVVTLSGGSISVSLMATDDPDLTPSGWAYQVTEKISGQAPVTYFLQFPASQSPVDLSSKTPLQAVSNLAGYVPTTAIGAANGVASLDSTGQVPATQLGNAVGGGGVPSSRTINTTAPLSGGGNLSADRTISIADASTTAKGVVQLAGDLAGTAAAPTVPGLAGKANSSHSHAESDITGLATDLSTLTTSVAGKLSLSGGTLTGALTLAADPTANLQAATKQYVDAHAGGGGSGMDQVHPLSAYSLIAASGDPENYQSTSQIGNNTIFFVRAWIPASTPITGLAAAVRDAGAWDGSTTGNGLGLYDITGNQVALTPADETLWTANDWRRKAFASQVAAGSGRWVYIGILLRGMATQPNFPFLTNAADGHSPWFNSTVGGVGRRCFYIGASAFPASFNPTTAGTATCFVPLLGAY